MIEISKLTGLKMQNEKSWQGRGQKDLWMHEWMDEWMDVGWVNC
jgi:hypothetical protein